MESSSCSTSGTHCFACVRNLMICHKRQVSGSETIPNGSYPRNVLHSLTVCCIITNYADDSFLFRCFSLFRFFGGIYFVFCLIFIFQFTDMMLTPVLAEHNGVILVSIKEKH